MKKVFSLFSILFLLSGIYAQSVSMTRATEVARQFFDFKGKGDAECVKTVSENNQALYYIFNAGNSFAVVSGDMRMPAILAYCDQAYNEQEVIAPVQMWLDFYQNQISYLKRETGASFPINPQWQALENGAGFRVKQSVSPLLTSTWDQGADYNYYCPKDADGDNGRVATGCVATAMAQLIYYFRFPETGIGSYSYVDENYGPQYANYGETTYDYAAMCDEPYTVNPAISRLIYDFGVGVDMHYGPDGSGMYNHSAARVLRTYFKYSPETEYLFRDSTTLNWDSVIVSHLERGIPMYYAGWDEPDISGHGFICDGFQDLTSNYYFHFNFGWGGYADGYFYTNQLTVHGNNFNVAQELIVNAYPDTSQYNYPGENPSSGTYTFTTPAGSFQSALPFTDVEPNSDYTWIIKPEVNNLISIKLKLQFDLSDYDSVFVMAPHSTSIPTRKWTYVTSTEHLNLFTDEVHVRYVTHTPIPGAGLKASYSVNLRDYCPNVVYYTEPTGIIRDGSGDSLYNNCSNCEYNILANNYSAVILHILNLDLEENHDFLHLYRRTSAGDSLITSFTGHLADSVYIADFHNLHFVFESDEEGTDEGFNIEYEAGQVGIPSIEPHEISVFPNPTTDLIYINSPEKISNIAIYDIAGRMVQQEVIDRYQYELSLRELPTGLYFLRLETHRGLFTHKVIKQ